METAPTPRTSEKTCAAPKVWVARLTLTNFRNYRHATLEPSRRPVVLVGPNGAGKTNLLEAVSLMAPGQGLRRASFPDLAHQKGNADWAIAARLIRGDEPIDIGTGLRPTGDDRARPARIVKIDGTLQSGSGALADVAEVAWLTPASDGLFTGPASERRRFLDRLILCFDPSHRTRANQFDRAMRQRNRLLEGNVHDRAQFAALEKILAEAGVAMAAARKDAVSALSDVSERRRSRAPESPFPWSLVALQGTLENALADKPAIDVEDFYVDTLARERDRDRGAGRTLTGPHRSDLIVAHGPKEMPAKLCSTGEQKALLVGLILAHAELAATRRDGCAPILLLDEIAAHLDAERRAALFEELLQLGTQAWMTGTDRTAFSGLEGRADFFVVDDGKIIMT